MASSDSKLIDLIASSDGFFDLEEGMDKQAEWREISPVEKARKVTNLWRERNKFRAVWSAQDALRLAEPVFPELSVSSGGKNYFLHGMTHLYYASRLKTHVREWLSTEVTKRNPFYFEQNFPRHFPEVEGEDLQDHFDGKGYNSMHKLHPFRHIHNSMYGLASYFLLPALTWLVDKSFEAGEVNTVVLANITRRLNQAYEATYRYVDITTIPGRLGIETSHVFFTSDKMRSTVRYSESPNVATLSERSFYMTQKLMCSTVLTPRLLTGALHVPQVAYFLQNPTYRFDDFVAEFKERNK